MRRRRARIACDACDIKTQQRAMDASAATRGAIVGAAMGADVIVNYPLWIVAKRVGAGLKALPPLSLLYSGGGALWLSIAPTCIIEDGVTTELKRYVDAPDVILAGCSGVAAAVCVTSQVERVITCAHARCVSVSAAAASILKERGVRSLLLPPGMTAMALREAPFAAALFALRPRISEAVERRAPPNTPRPARELACGCAAAAVGAPPSHAPSVVAAYESPRGICLRRVIEGGAAAATTRIIPRRRR